MSRGEKHNLTVRYLEHFLPNQARTRKEHSKTDGHSLRKWIRLTLLIIPILTLSACDEEWLQAYYQALRRGMPADTAQLLKSGTLSDSASAALAQQLSSTDPFLSSVDNTSCSTMIETSPRGLACLHCTEPAAQTQARVLTVIMLESCLKNLAVNYLVDDTFDFDPAFLLQQMHALTSNGRKLEVTFYLSNGPWQRRYSNPPENNWVTEFSPQEFRSAIFSNQILRKTFASKISRLIPVLNYAASRGATIYISPMLEDNLDDRSFSEMLSIIQDELPDSLSVYFVRNACPGCYSGNTSSLPFAVAREIHGVNLPTGGDKRTATITNDGIEYMDSFWNKELDTSLRTVPIETMTALRDKASEENVSFILWSGKRQGVFGEMIPPAERNYVIPSFRERLFLVNFLKGQAR
ncbi:MAG: hypothetical protein PHC51_04350 [bacterium]|nr:hypothetical protein [bacterium]